MEGSGGDFSGGGNCSGGGSGGGSGGDFISFEVKLGGFVVKTLQKYTFYIYILFIIAMLYIYINIYNIYIKQSLRPLF